MYVDGDENDLDDDDITDPSSRLDRKLCNGHFFVFLSILCSHLDVHYVFDNVSIFLADSKSVGLTFMSWV